MRRLRIGVPAGLAAIDAAGGGHGKVWRRVLDELSREDEVVPLAEPGRGLRARLGRGALRAGRGGAAVDVVLASGHDALPDTSAPLVVEVHEAGWFDEELRAVLDPGFLAYIEEQTAQAISRASAVITLSEAARRDILATHEVAPERVHAVWLGVDPHFTPRAGGGMALVARALGEDPHRGVPYVLHAAMLHPRKNLAAVREAVTELAHAGFPHRLAVAGRPPVDRADWEEIEQAARAELEGAPGRVAFLGSVGDAELAGLMAGAAAFCLPSLYEGFGLTVLEAMACGTPVVVSDRGALPEVVGNAGVVTEPRGPAVAQALRQLLGDPSRAAAMRQAGLERAAQFTWERTAAGWRAVLLEAAASG